MKKLVIILLSFIHVYTFAQGELDSLLSRLRMEVEIDFEADRMDVDGEGNIYLLSSSGAQIYKLFVQQNYDSLIFIGGASVREEALFHPIGIRAKNRQRVYVLDDVSQKLTLLNTNLKVLQSFDFRQEGADLDAESEIFPISFDLSPTGELFVLNQWDNTVIRFSNQLNPSGNFAGTNYGEGSLFQPLSMEVSEKQEVFVWDQQLRAIMVYSIYGIFEFSIPIGEEWQSGKFRLVGNYLISLEPSSLQLYHIPTKRYGKLDLSLMGKIKDFAANREHFYFLTSKGIYIYPRSD